MRTVISVYDMIHEKFSDMLNDSETIRQKEQVISGADVLVALSSQTRDDLVNMMGIQPERVRVIYPGLTRDFVGNMSTSYDAEWQRLLNITGPYWLHVGCRRSYKNFSVLLRAFVSVAHDTDCFLVVVGGEPDLQPDEILLLERHDCRQRVRLVSDVDDAVLQAMYSQAIAFVSCSLGEGFGLTLLEAMACSAPVVASDIPVFHEVVGDAGLYFDPLDSGMLAGRLLESLKATTREDCRNKGQQRLPLFSWEKAANDYAQVYHEVAES
jgi:glycosyltransferase involved in cell wall biosynthesis